MAVAADNTTAIPAVAAASRSESRSGAFARASRSPAVRSRSYHTVEKPSQCAARVPALNE